MWRFDEGKYGSKDNDKKELGQKLWWKAQSLKPNANVEPNHSGFMQGAVAGNA
jgi:hypothetical protein